MKKLTTLVLAAGLVVSAFAGSASAGEFKPNAQFAEEFVYGDAGNGMENFNAATRVRFGFDYVASEDLSATILFQYRDLNWGEGANFDGDPDFNNSYGTAQMRLRLAYIDWTIPGTEVKVRMGRQPLVAPSYAFGSAVLDGRGDAIKFAGNVNENISLGFAWLALDSDTRNVPVVGDDGEANALMLNAEFAYDGFKVAPWAMYVSKQANAFGGYDLNDYGSGNAWLPENAALAGATLSADAYVLGISAELNMFDPFVFALDALYNNITVNRTAPGQEDSFDGFYVAAKGSYKFSNGTASLGAWYATGNDKDDAKNDNGFILLDGGFSATSIMFDGNVVGVDGFTCRKGGDTPFGTWGVIAEYAGFSFVEKLTHTAKVAYIEGTNETDSTGAPMAGTTRGLSYLTEDDSVIEFNFDTTYEIYKNFSATLQLGYAVVDQDDIAKDKEQDDIFRSALAFVYKF